VLEDDTHAAASRVEFVLGGTVGGPTVADPTKPELILRTHFAEQDTLVEHRPGGLELNRWYDVKVETRGNEVVCWLDGERVFSANVLRRREPTLFTSAVKDAATGEVILKVVNPGGETVRGQVVLSGAGAVAGTARATVLSGRPEDEDLPGEAAKVKPVEEVVNGVGARFGYGFRPYSVTVVRVGASALKRGAF
jgi:hypothetical protein